MSVGYEQSSIAFSESNKGYCINGEITLHPSSERQYLVIAHALIDTIDFTLMQDTIIVIEKILGDQVPVSERDFYYHHPTILMPTQAGLYQFEMHLNRLSHPFNAPLKLIQESTLLRQAQKYNRYTGFIGAVYFLYVIILLIAYRIFRYKFLLLYALYISVGLIYFLHRIGQGQLLLWENNYWLQQALDGIEGITVATILFFFWNIFSVNNRFPKFSIVILFTIVINVGVSILELLMSIEYQGASTFFEPMAKFAFLFNVISILLINYIAIRSIKGSIRQLSNWYVIGVISFSVIFAVIGLYYNGIFLHHSFLLEVLIPTFFIVELLILIFSLFAHYQKTLIEDVDLKLKLAHSIEEASNQLIEGEMNERKRISRELHDGLGGNISAIRFFVDALMHNNKPSFLNEILPKVLSKIDLTIHELRSIIKNLYTDFHAEFNDNIKGLCSDIERNYGIQIHFDFKSMSLTSKQEYHLIRITQELLQNAVKHSKATNIWLSLKQENQTIILTYQDDGIGLNHVDKKTETKTFGLSNMADRVKLLGGDEITIEKEPGLGILISFPHQAK